MANNLYLYKECKITRERNAKVDSIENYLATLISNTTAMEIQYQQIALHKKLKLDLPQAQVGKETYNYLKIVQDNKNFYYFIDKANWKSTHTVEFDLTLDTVNTFANDFTFNKKTRIIRQHKDRLKTEDYVIQNDEIWTYVPANKDVVLNPWASENEMYDTFYVRGLGDLDSCTITIYQNGEVLATYDNVKAIEQDYVGQSGVAMYFVYQVDQALATVVLEYDDLINAFNHGIYYVVRFVGNVSDLVYDPNDAWTSLFYGYYQRRLIRLIDQKEEGINPPQFKYNSETVITNNNEVDDIPWDLVYYSQNAYDQDHPENFTLNNPIDCFLYPSTNISILANRSANTTFTESSFDTGDYYYFLPEDVSPDGIHDTWNFRYGYGSKVDYSIELTNDNFTTTWPVNVISSKYTMRTGRHTTQTYTNLTTVPFWVVIYKTDTQVKVYQFYYAWDSSHSYRNKVVYNDVWVCNKADFKMKFNSTSKFVYGYKSSALNNTTNQILYWKSFRDNYISEYAFNFNNILTFNLVPIPETLRTSSQMIKITRIPYCPLAKFESNASWCYDTNGWTWDNTMKAFKKDDLNANILSEIELPWNPLSLLYLDYVEPSISDVRDDIYESKIYNSEFYICKMVYDTNSYTYNYENIDINDLSQLMNYKNIDYQVSNTFTGNFLFKMNVPLNRSVSDYDNICLVNINNEMPIYTSAFLDYVRTGYNYDVKNKNMSLAKGVATTALSTAGGVLSGLAIGAMSGSSVGPVGTVIGAAVGLAGGLISLAFQQAQADNNIKQKLEQSSRQAANISGIDDINLLTAYTDGDKAKLVEYQASKRVINTVRDLFYYCGYADDVREVPSLSTRTWFNFIQCEPVFNESSNTVYKEYEDDIKQRYQEGITVYHKVNNSYDWDQTKENWESSLLNQGE